MITDKQIVDAVPMLRKYAIALTRNPQFAMDLVQDTVVRILEARASGQYTEQGSFTGWACVIMRNLTYNYCARRNPRARLHYDIESAQHLLPPVEPTQELHHQLRDVRRVWDRIPPVYTAALAAVAEGASYAEVAAKQHVRVGTIKSRVNRARTELRTVL